MIVIFAQQNTNKKVAIECISTASKANMQSLLIQKFGGNWLSVEDIKYGNILVFEDDQVYQGYNAKKTTPYANVKKLY